MCCGREEEKEGERQIWRSACGPHESANALFPVLCPRTFFPSPEVARKTRLLQVVYNASNNELVRTNTLVKNSIVAIDATPFKAW